MAFVPRDPVRRDELTLFAKKIAIVILFALIVWLLWAGRAVLILVFISAALAAGIAPVVHRVRVVWRHLTHRSLSRGTAVLLVYFPCVLFVIGLVVIVVPQLIDQTHALGAQFPTLFERNIVVPLSHYVPMGRVRDYVRENGFTLPQGRLFGVVRGTATAFASFIAVLFMVVYMLMDAHRLRNLILLFYPPAMRAERRQMLNRMARRMSLWLSAQLILSAIMGVAVFAGLLLLRIPYALPLAIFAMLGELVPVIGPIVGCAPALLLALLQSRWQFWSVLILILILQKLENLIIAPRVMSRRVSISPLTAFIAFMLGAAALGIVGAIMAIPATAVVQVWFDEMFVDPRERRYDRARMGTLRGRA